MLGNNKHIVGQVGIKIQISVTEVKGIKPVVENMSLDGKANSVNKISLPILPILSLSLNN